MTTDRDPTFEGKQTEQGNAYPPGRVVSRESGRAHPGTPATSGFGTILTSGVLALLMGAAGAWAYVDYLGPMLAKNRKKKPTGRPEFGAEIPGFRRLELKDLSGKLDELQSRVDRLPKAISAQDSSH